MLDLDKGLSWETKSGREKIKWELPVVISKRKKMAKINKHLEKVMLLGCITYFINLIL